MLQPPVSMALREAMHTARRSSPLLAQGLKLSRPATAPKCRHMSSVPTQVSKSLPMLAVRTSRPLPPATAMELIKQRRAASTVAANHTSPVLNADTSSSRAPPSTISTPAPVSPTTAVPTATATTLTWNRFLALRAVRRRFNLVASVSTSIVTTVAGIQILSGQDLEKLGSMLFGIDPIMAMGLSSVGCGAVGWLLGPFAGGAVFGLWYRRLGPEIASKEKQFYQRIKRYRVDPSSQSMSNPVPDYYGEKISSVQDYRRWLKDQRAFTKKRQSF